MRLRACVRACFSVPLYSFVCVCLRNADRMFACRSVRSFHCLSECLPACLHCGSIYRRATSVSMTSRPNLVRSSLVKSEPIWLTFEAMEYFRRINIDRTTMGSLRMELLPCFPHFQAYQILHPSFRSQKGEKLVRFENITL